MIIPVMYHYVTEFDKEIPFRSFLHVGDFRKQLLHFRSRYDFLTRMEWEAFITQGRLPAEDKVLLTFDDGLKCHFDHVAPVLNEFDVFGIFYVCTFPLVEQKMLSVHRVHELTGRFGAGILLEELLKVVRANELHFDRRKWDESIDQPYQRESDGISLRKFKRILNYSAEVNRQDELLDQLESIFDVSACPEEFYLSKEEVLSLADQGNVIGSHGHTHALLSMLSIRATTEEVKVSKDILEEILGNRVDHFCFPFGGRKSYSDTTLKAIKDAGYKSSMSVDAMPVQASSSTYELPRFDTNYFRYGARYAFEQN